MTAKIIRSPITRNKGNGIFTQYFSPGRTLNPGGK